MPGAPSSRNRCPRENPPDRISSSPQMPVFALPATRFGKIHMTPSTGVKPMRRQTVPRKRELFFGKERRPHGPPLDLQRTEVCGLQFAGIARFASAGPSPIGGEPSTCRNRWALRYRPRASIRSCLAPATTNFSGSSTTCRDTMARIPRARFPSRTGCPSSPRSGASRIRSRSRATGADDSWPLNSRSRSMSTRPFLQASGSSSSCARAGTTMAISWPIKRRARRQQARAGARRHR